jgi:hypothetical protein
MGCQAGYRQLSTMSDFAKRAAGRDQVHVDHVIAVGEVHTLPLAMLLHE